MSAFLFQLKVKAYGGDRKSLHGFIFFTILSIQSKQVDLQKKNNTQMSCVCFLKIWKKTNHSHFCEKKLEFKHAIEKI